MLAGFGFHRVDTDLCTGKDLAVCRIGGKKWVFATQTAASFALQAAAAAAAAGAAIATAGGSTASGVAPGDACATGSSAEGPVTAVDSAAAVVAAAAAAGPPSEANTRELVRAAVARAETAGAADFVGASVNLVATGPAAGVEAVHQRAVSVRGACCLLSMPPPAGLRIVVDRVTSTCPGTGVVLSLRGLVVPADGAMERWDFVRLYDAWVASAAACRLPGAAAEVEDDEGDDTDDDQEWSEWHATPDFVPPLRFLPIRAPDTCIWPGSSFIA